MAVTTTGSPVVSGNSGSTSITKAATLAADADYLLVGFKLTNGIGSEASTCTYNGVSMTKIVAYQHTLAAGQWFILYGLVAPAVSVSHNIVASEASSNSFSLISQAFKGVHQTVPTGNTGSAECAGGSLGITGLNVSSSATALVVDYLAITNNNTLAQLTATGTNTAITTDDSQFTDGMSKQVGSATTNFQWTWINGDFGADVGVELLPSSSFNPATIVGPEAAKLNSARVGLDHWWS